MTEKSIRKFWNWFENNAGNLSRALERSPTNPADFSELGARLHAVHAELRWEFGPSPGDNWLLVISPNGDRDLVHAAKQFVGLCPTIAGWSFAACKPRKDLLQLRLLVDGVVVDGEQWRYGIIAYPGQDFIDLRIQPRPDMPEDEALVPAWLFVEALLGEAALLDHIGDIELLSYPDEEWEDRLSPLQVLREHAITLVPAIGTKGDF